MGGRSTARHWLARRNRSREDKGDFSQGRLEVVGLRVGPFCSLAAASGAFISPIHYAGPLVCSAPELFDTGHILIMSEQSAVVPQGKNAHEEKHLNLNSDSLGTDSCGASFLKVHR